MNLQVHPAPNSPSSHHSAPMPSMSMPMTISWRTDCLMFLFQTFHADTPLEFALACLGVLVLSVVNQLMVLPAVRGWIIGPGGMAGRGSQQNGHVVLVETHSDTQRAQGTTTQQPEHKPQTPNPAATINTRKYWHVLRVMGYHTVYTVMSLAVMLLAMTMNAYVIGSIAVGTGLGKSILAFSNQKQSRKQSSGHNEEQQQHNCCEM